MLKRFPFVYCRSIANAHRSGKQAISERSDIVYTLVLCACLFPGPHCKLLLPTAAVPPRSVDLQLFVRTADNKVVGQDDVEVVDLRSFR